MKHLRVLLSVVILIFLVLNDAIFLLRTSSVRISSISEASEIEKGHIRVGLYSARIPFKDPREERLKKLRKLQGMGVNTVIEGQYLLGEQFKEFVFDLHSHGIKLAAKVTREADWYGPRGKRDFDTSKAEKKIKEASSFVEFFDYLYLAHEVHEFATHEKRVEMYKLAKRYFPNTQIIMYYGGSIDRMEKDYLLKHYQYGRGETDIALITVKVEEQGNLDINTSLKRLERVWKIIKQRSPDVKIWVLTNFSNDERMRNDKTSMWSPRQIQAFGKALIQSGKLDGFFFRGFGRFTYDLGYPEWEEQRRAVASLFLLNN